MPDALASQVAAGEVVERPASVVKELVENSIDAGATKIEVRISRGGISLISVTDNGHGMNRSDAMMCVERHATSKIRKTEDLSRILTLGFRGEALPSIASVSKFRLHTREGHALKGTEIAIDGGKMGDVRDSGEAPGTRIEVRSLFYNIPARRKFLRTENTEFSHVEQQVRVQAIAHPQIGFTLIHGNRTVFQLPPASNLFERIQGLAGREVANRLIEVPKRTKHDISIHGYIGKPGLGRTNRAFQLVFLNGRPIEAAIITYALREGYHSALMKGQYPVTFLFLEMDPSLVDVNVHPAKKEVRFHSPATIRDFLSETVASTILGERPKPQPLPELAKPVQEERPRLEAASKQEELIPESEQRSLRKDWAELPSTPTESPKKVESPQWAQEQMASEDRLEPKKPESPRAEFKVVGTIGKHYAVMESDEGMVLMDHRAAHERVLYEQSKARMANEGVPSQKLLIPLTLELSPKDFGLVSQNLDALQRMGIGAEVFGANAIKIDALPTFVTSDDPIVFANELLEELKRDSTRSSSTRLADDAIATSVCRQAVKASRTLHATELDQLVKDLFACELPYCCPKGRPTLIQFSFSELEKKFGR